MAVITMPAEVLATLAQQGFGQRRFDLADVSDETGDSAVNAGAPPRWTCTLRSAEGLTLDESAAWEAMLLRLRGGINVLAVHDQLRPVPRGTMRGAPILGQAWQQGASSLMLANVVGTLVVGDWLEVGQGQTSQLVKVVAPASSTVLTPTAAGWLTSGGAAATWQTTSAQPATWWLGGTATVQVEPPARRVQVVGSAVRWDKPVAHFAYGGQALQWEARAGGPMVTGFSFDGLERWA